MEQQQTKIKPDSEKAITLVRSANQHLLIAIIYIAKDLANKNSSFSCRH